MSTAQMNQHRMHRRQMSYPQMIPQTQTPGPWSPHYDVNRHYVNQKKLGKPHNTLPFLLLHSSFSSSINVLGTKPRTSLFSIPLHFYLPVKALIDTGAFSSAMP